MGNPLRLLSLLGLLLIGCPGWAGTLPTAGRPLAEALNADGTLKPGMAGSFNPKGYELLDVAGSQQPTFRPVSAKRTQDAGDEKWRTGFELPGPQGGAGMNSPVYALVVDSSGNVYAGGAFTQAGSMAANHVAR